MSNQSVEKAFELARQRYVEYGVSVENAIKNLKKISLSVHCWQTDDVAGFEKQDSALHGGGTAVTGNYFGKARDMKEMRADLEKVFSLMPGKHRLALHAIYGDFGGKPVDRDKVSPEHFASWIAWAKKNKVELDFNSTSFSHPKSDDGFSLASKDKKKRQFWIEHHKRSREIAAAMGKAQKTPCIHNIWVHDGDKDLTVDRYGYRKILKDALDEVFAVNYPKEQMRDALECKLFGLGSESFTVGSHEFYLGYALTKGKMMCYDMGHFHPTESVADKISSAFLYFDEMLLHISRPVRWDSDHVTIFNDDVRYLCEELVRTGKWDKAWMGLDFFDGTMNRIGAYTIGSRGVLKGMLAAFLEPLKTLKDYEEKGNRFARLALMEEAKSLPLGAVWDYYCESMKAPMDRDIIKDILAYEKDVCGRRV